MRMTEPCVYFGAITRQGETSDRASCSIAESPPVAGIVPDSTDRGDPTEPSMANASRRQRKC
jgi:hypothetical protein